MAPVRAGRARELGVEVDERGARDVTLFVEVPPRSGHDFPADVEQRGPRSVGHQPVKFADSDQRPLGPIAHPGVVLPAPLGSGQLR